MGDNYVVFLPRVGQFHAPQEGTRYNPCAEGSRHHNRSLVICRIEREREPLQILTEC